MNVDEALKHAEASVVAAADSGRGKVADRAMSLTEWQLEKRC